MTGRQDEGSERRVTTLELFFDLVFVFTITQLTVLLAHDLSLAQVGRTLVIFAVLFWMYGAYAYLTNQVPPETTGRRVPLLLGMCGFMTCALALPGVFGDNGVAFGLGFLLVVLVHSALYALLHGRNVLSFALTNILAALCVTAAGVVDDSLAADGLWVAALLLQTVTPVLASRVRVGAAQTPVTERVGELDPAHFVERHGLLLLIVFGESVIAIGAGVGDATLDWGTFGGIALALALAAALWWSYFLHDEAAAEAALRRVSGLPRFRLTMRAYYYSFIPMLVGVAVLAAGVKLSIGHLPQHLPTAVAVAVAGGVSLYLSGSVCFRVSLGLRPLLLRSAAAALAWAAVPAGTRVSALAEFLGLVLLLTAMLRAESGRSRARAAGGRPEPGRLAQGPAAAGARRGRMRATDEVLAADAERGQQQRSGD
ncbi:low temperature requirement protein A [Streptacidiphilus monticola]|uniref:Low temperature requirement protein A n=1 Tax=Streptacidiphilus monticola TaxID=2161674 RepID=A0ABW1G255_9ACTN